MKRRISYLFLLFFLTFCTDHEDLFDRPYPSVVTNSVTNITSNGAKFNGDLLEANGNEIIDHGFVWGIDATLNVKSDNKKPMGELIGSGPFSIEISTTLVEDQVYYVRSYVQTSELTVYGNVVSFTSLGSKAPIITDFEPKRGRISDTVSIKGIGFSFIKNNNEVKFSESVAKIISHSDTLLTVSVPEDLTLLKSKISVSVIGNITLSMDDFELIGPELFSISTSTVKPCDTLVILGNNFSENIETVKVLLNTTECDIIDLQSNQIVVRAPVFQPASETVTLKVVSSNIEAVFNESLTYKKPVIFGLTSRLNTTFNDTLKITAKNLPRCEDMIITIGTTVPSLVVYNDSIISFKIPESLTQTQNTVTVSYQDTPLNYSQLFSLSEPTIEFLSPSNGTFDDLVTIHGKNFHPQKERNLITLAGWGISALTATPTKLTAKVSVYSNAMCDICNHVYVQVDQQSVSLLQDAFTLNAPIITSISPTSLTAPGQVTIHGENFNPQMDLNEVFVGNSVLASSATTQKIIAEVDINTLSSGDPYISSTRETFVEVGTGGQNSNQQSITFNYDGPWTKKSDFPGIPRLYPTTFVINEKLYLGLGQDKSGQFLTDFWEYNPANDSWIQKNDFPGSSRIRGISFVANGKAYAGLGQTSSSLQKDLWDYNPSTDSWTRLNDFPGEARRDAESFVIDNVAYVTSGEGLTNKSDVWKFVPSTETWIQLQDAPVSFRYQNNFVLSGKAYHVHRSNFDFKLYEYNPITDAWIDKITYTPNILPTAVGGGYIYGQGVVFLKYDPLTNSFISLQLRPTTNRYSGSSSEIQNKQYIFGGLQIIQIVPSPETVFYTDLWEFDYSKYPD